MDEPTTRPYRPTFATLIGALEELENAAKKLGKVGWTEDHPEAMAVIEASLREIERKLREGVPFEAQDRLALEFTLERIYEEKVA